MGGCAVRRGRGRPRPYWARGGEGGERKAGEGRGEGGEGAREKGGRIFFGVVGENDYLCVLKGAKVLP